MAQMQKGSAKIYETACNCVSLPSSLGGSCLSLPSSVPRLHSSSAQTQFGYFCVDLCRLLSRPPSRLAYRSSLDRNVWSPGPRSFPLLSFLVLQDCLADAPHLLPPCSSCLPDSESQGVFISFLFFYKQTSSPQHVHMIHTTSAMQHTLYIHK